MELEKLNRHIAELGPFTVADTVLAAGESISPLLPDLKLELPLEVVHELGRDLGEVLQELVASIPRITSKRCIVLPGAELRLLEAVQAVNPRADVIIAIGSQVDPAAARRLAANIPPGMSVSVRQIPHVPTHSRPSDLVVVALGLRGGYRFVHVPHWVVSVAEFYRRVFAGEVVMLDPAGEPTSSRLRNWRTVNQDLFTQIISAEPLLAASGDSV